MKIVLVLILAISVSACVTTTVGTFHNKMDSQEAVDSYVSLGAGYLKKDQIQRAKEKLDRALELDPKSSEAHHIYALVWQREDEPELAEDHFDKAISYDGDNARARHAYGVFLMNQKDYGDACDELEEAAENTSYNQRYLAYSDLGLCEYRDGDSDAAIEHFQKSVRLNRFNYDALINLTTLFIDNKDYVNARRYYRRFTNLVQMRKVGHNAQSLLLGIQLAQKGNDKKSEQSFARMLKKNFPNSIEYKAYRQKYSKRG